MLEVPASVTRTGVLKYRRPDGRVVHELRHPDDVFAAESLASLQGASVTVFHSTEEVVAGNAAQHEVGFVMQPGQRADDGIHVNTELSVRHADAVKRVQSRDLQEVSCGYRCDEEQAEPGAQYEGQRYDVRQRNIRYNHVALLPSGTGRAGRTVRVHLDAADAVADEAAEHFEVSTAERKTMHKVRLDGVDWDVESPQLAQAFTSALEKRDEQIAGLADDRDAAVKRADAAEGELAATQTKLDEASDPKRLDALVAARVELEGAALKVLPSDAKLDGLSTREVHEKVLRHLDPKVKLDGESDDYVRGAFNGALRDAARKPETPVKRSHKADADDPKPTSWADRMAAARAPKEN
jgi:hypothetical protein